MIIRSYNQSSRAALNHGVRSLHDLKCAGARRTSPVVVLARIFQQLPDYHADIRVLGEPVTYGLAANIIFQLFYGGLLIADHILDQVA